MALICAGVPVRVSCGQAMSKQSLLSVCYWVSACGCGRIVCNDWHYYR